MRIFCPAIARLTLSLRPTTSDPASGPDPRGRACRRRADDEGHNCDRPSSGWSERWETGADLTNVTGAADRIRGASNLSRGMHPADGAGPTPAPPSPPAIRQTWCVRSGAPGLSSADAPHRRIKQPVHSARRGALDSNPVPGARSTAAGGAGRPIRSTPVEAGAGPGGPPPPDHAPRRTASVHPGRGTRAGPREPWFPGPCLVGEAQRPPRMIT